MNSIENSILHDIIKHPKKISILNFDIISNIIKRFKKILEEEYLLLEFSLEKDGDDVYVIGDIHGDLETLTQLIDKINKNCPKIVIFLGDIVDRGPMQFECLLIILALKILYPSKYYILRGNHETLEMNEYYGFYQDFISRFRDQSKFNEILSIYNLIPICALVNRVVLCLHGGIPQDIDILKKIQGYKCKNFREIYNSNMKGIFQIMWNDPKSELRGFSKSFRGSGIKFFGNDVFENFLKNNDLKYIIRAHECFAEGYRWFFNERMLSIFSSANYRGSNPASYAIIRNNKIIPKILS